MAALARKGWSQREFSEQLRLRGVKQGQVFIAQVITGTAAMPVKHLTAWAEVLEIPTKERKRFELLGAVSYLPDQYRVELERLIEKAWKTGKQ